MLWAITSVLVLNFNTFGTISTPDNIDSSNVVGNDLSDDHIRWNGILIYPGTKWCGAGNISQSYDDLGELKDLDKCCREHDNCPDIILGFHTKHGLKNAAFHTRLNCKCDNSFYKCLKNVNTKDTIIIGRTYFDIINTKCFKLEYPIVECVEEIKTPFKKCKEYKLDPSSEKIYQWFDVPTFSSNKTNIN